MVGGPRIAGPFFTVGYLLLLCGLTPTVVVCLLQEFELCWTWSSWVWLSGAAVSIAGLSWLLVPSHFYFAAAR